ncbi:PTS transporter subunit IIC [Clostridium culturomicium]|uniref:PTS transporter subunit IIC n=1 Tax=Clostridium culturomicium TaxID=1499683 RepID=UPI00059127E7|nr:PTS sugar transporter subunit IIC [Clostridium culturomicium]
MKKLKNYLNHIFIDGLSGMSLGLFATLIIGTILQQIGNLFGGTLGSTIYLIGKVAAATTCAGIGVGVAYKYKSSPLVVISAAVSGLIGGYAPKILSGTIMTEAGVITLSGPGEPLGAFLAVLVAIEIGNIISGKTKIDIIITPLITIGIGAAVGLIMSPPISRFMTSLGNLIMFSMDQQPFIMGILVSVIMGILLTLPISSAAIGVILNLSGITAGAATVGCCCQMVGFAVASYRENKFGGLLAQGIGTSMLQIPNIIRKPIIWLPSIISSAILGPIASTVLKMTNNATGSGMGSAGFVGQIMTYETMVETMAPNTVLFLIVIMHFILPALLTLVVSEYMRTKQWIKYGDMSLNL